MKILIIEDDEPIRKTVCEMLEYSGYSVIAAVDGFDGLSKLAQRPDFIISDIAMPGMDGFAFREKLLQIPEMAGIPFVFLSAQSGSQYIGRAKELGAVACLVKPFSSQDLLAVVRTNWYLALAEPATGKVL